MKPARNTVPLPEHVSFGKQMVELLYVVLLGEESRESVVSAFKGHLVKLILPPSDLIGFKAVEAEALEKRLGHRDANKLL